MLTVILFCFFIDHVLKSADYCFVLTGLSFLFRTCHGLGLHDASLLINKRCLFACSLNAELWKYFNAYVTFPVFILPFVNWYNYVYMDFVRCFVKYCLHGILHAHQNLFYWPCFTHNKFYGNTLHLLCFPWCSCDYVFGMWNIFWITVFNYLSAWEKASFYQLKKNIFRSIIPMKQCFDFYLTNI